MADSDEGQEAMSEREHLPDRTALREKMQAARDAYEARRAAEVAEDAAELRATLDRILDGAKARGQFTDAPDDDPAPAFDRQAHEERVIAEMRARADRLKHAGERANEKAVAAERERLAGPLSRSGGGFEGYDPARHEAAGRALEAVQRFASGRPPRGGVLLFGSLGLGKTRLLLASHLELLSGGVRSAYLTTPELRLVFRAGSSFDRDTALEAQRRLEVIRRAEAVHLDDLGDVEGDERKRGDFTEGLKALLDGSVGAWAVASNCSWEEATAHPDVGGKILDRLRAGAVLVPMSGRSQRRMAGGTR